MNDNDISATLERVLTSHAFSRSARLRSLLRYVVSAQSTKRNHWIREAAVALDVFRRDPATFDSMKDGIVRVSFNRLRKLLSRYYEDEGQHDLLRFEIPRGGYSVIVRRRMSGVLSSPVRIAVLPLANLTNDEAHEALCDGLTDDLIDALAKVPQLRALARTSTRRFRNTDLDVREIAKTLAVDTLIEGSVQRVGDQMRITVQMILGRDGTHLWSQAFESDTHDRAAMQAALLDIIAQSLDAHSDRSKRLMESLEVNTVGANARSLLDQARSNAALFSDDGLRRAESLCLQATRLDPSYAAAWAQMANVRLLRRLSYSTTELVPVESIEACVTHALAIDPEEPIALSVRGYHRIAHLHQWEAGFSDVRKAVENAPHDPLVCMRAGYLSMAAGDYTAAREMFDLSLEIDPFHPLTNYNCHLLEAVEGNFEQSAQSLSLGRQRTGNIALFDEAEIALLLATKRHDEALAFAQKLHSAHHAALPFVYRLAQTYAVVGDLSMARNLFDPHYDHINPAIRDYLYASIESNSDERERFFYYVNKALDMKSPGCLCFALPPFPSRLNGPEGKAVFSRMRRASEPPFSPLEMRGKGVLTPSRSFSPSANAGVATGGYPDAS
jgi:TolB-like protein